VKLEFQLVQMVWCFALQKKTGPQGGRGEDKVEDEMEEKKAATTRLSYDVA